MPGAGRPLIVQDVPSAPLAIEAPIGDTITPTTPAPSPPPILVVQEVALGVAEVSVLVVLAGFVVMSSSIIVVSLLSVSLVTSSALMVSTMMEDNDGRRHRQMEVYCSYCLESGAP